MRSPVLDKSPLRLGPDLAREMAAALEAGDYKCVEDIVVEGLWFWRERRLREFKELEQLQFEIKELLASRRPHPARAEALRARARGLLRGS